MLGPEYNYQYKSQGWFAFVYNELGIDRFFWDVCYDEVGLIKVRGFFIYKDAHEGFGKNYKNEINQRWRYNVNDPYCFFVCFCCEVWRIYYYFTYLVPYNEYIKNLVWWHANIGFKEGPDLL